MVFEVGVDVDIEVTRIVGVAVGVGGDVGVAVDSASVQAVNNPATMSAIVGQYDDTGQL